MVFHRQQLHRGGRIRYTCAGKRPGTRYLISGRETASSGTRHLQGFVIFHRRIRFGSVRGLFPRGVHLECARGTSQQAADYCKKESDFSEFGELPLSQGRRNDWDAFREWSSNAECMPTLISIARDFPHLYARYGERMLVIAEANRTAPELLARGSTPRDWQVPLRDSLLLECEDDRSVLFYVDEQGNQGKSWFCRYMLQNYSEVTQVLGVGKRTDIAYMIDPTKRIFLFDIDRSSADYLQYPVLEQLKDRLVTSTKYAGIMKVIEHLPHVVVFMNKDPDMDALSEDRYIITKI